MNIGIVSLWWNRGQATVSRYIRTIFEALGHRTFVLAKPTPQTGLRPRFIDTTGVWAQEQVTYASNFLIPQTEYETWAKDHALDVVFFDENKQLHEIACLRSAGIKTIGRFVWEKFKEEHVSPAKEAFSIIYSLTHCEQARYHTLGIDSPKIQWGCHPELLAVVPQKFQDGIYFFFPGSFQGPRKPLQCVVEVFQRVTHPHIRLIIKAQGFRDNTEPIAIEGDPRITRMVDDLPQQEYNQLFSACHVCLAPARWEGLGLHLYEAVAFGMPIITNDAPPMNEVVSDQANGLLVRSHQIGNTPSGIPSYDPDIDQLAAAIEQLSDMSVITRMSQHTLQRRAEDFSWDQTTAQYEQLLTL
ncbi:glycosyltransferase [candidate division KSB3 bacterium]|uniref:Glycosyltransferase n=1 Tax=candidate division KSB3 bacterium TaxID=2044937 RepID=A0A9D5Q6J6_9BACT|nr:glycosyltransferase [candidate division KSB3 bacterium]MBD3325453.1 glycosyltransferase [candidate division KSB3 bacterium]